MLKFIKDALFDGFITTIIISVVVALFTDPVSVLVPVTKLIFVFIFGLILRTIITVITKLEVKFKKAE